MVKLRKKLEEHATIIGVWASISTIITLILTIFTIFQSQKLNSYTNLIENNVEIAEVKDQLIERLENEINSISINGDGNTAIQNSIINQIKMSPNDFSVDELLRQAEGEIDSKNYKNAFMIYSLDVLKDNIIAQCNLGYLYSNGFGVNKDLNKADSLYMMAYEGGCNQAIINKFVMYKNNIALDNGYESKIYIMLNDAIKSNANPMHKKVVEKYGNQLLDGNIEDLRQNECEWKLDAGVEKVGSRPIDTWRKRWYKISDTTQNIGNVYGNYQIWGYDVRSCAFDGIFSEELAR